jgi:hypothetical protein
MKRSSLLVLGGVCLVAACTIQRRVPPAPYGYSPNGPASQPIPTSAPPPVATQAAAPGAAPSAAPVASADPYASVRQQCIDATNAYRAKVGAPPLAPRFDLNGCSDGDARGDATNGSVHGMAGGCPMSAQNECPGWPSPPSGMLADCLKQMFDEGPGEPYDEHGHYINMTSLDYHSMTCGIYEQGGQVWLVENFFP